MTPNTLRRMGHSSPLVLLPTSAAKTAPRSTLSPFPCRMAQGDRGATVPRHDDTTDALAAKN